MRFYDRQDNTSPINKGQQIVAKEKIRKAFKCDKIRVCIIEKLRVSIYMINKFSNIDSKSFVNYSCNELLAKVNILFGMNGSGKSGLTKWIESRNPENTRVFSTEYVIQNIKVDDSAEINGVKITIGEQKVNFAVQVEDIEIANENLEKTIVELGSQQEGVKKNLFDLIENELKRAKESFKGIRINQKPNAKNDPISALKAWRQDINSDLEFSANTSLSELNAKKDSLNSEISNLNPILSTSLTLERFEKLNTSLAKPVAIPDNEFTSKLLDWLKEGLNLHNLVQEDESHKQMCEFCGNSFDSFSVKSMIDKKLNAEYSKLIQAIDRLEQQLPLSTDVIKLEKKLDKEILDAFEDAIKLIKEKLSMKRSNPMLNVRIDDKSMNDLFALDIAIQRKKTESSKELDAVKKDLSNQESLAKHQVAKNLQNISRVLELEAMIPKYEEQINKEKLAIYENKQQIKIWSERSDDYAPFKEIVNQELVQLGLEFKLELLNSGQGYRIEHNNAEVEMTVEDLSEGERRLLAFIHFYYDLFENISENSEKIDSAIQTIVIDDPITSFDADNRILLIERINSVIGRINNEDIQIFVLTHSSFDFHSFGYNVGNDKKRWRVNKDLNGESKITLVPDEELKNFSDYYKSAFLELADFALLTNSELSEKLNAYHYGNKMRVVLESNARSNYNIENVTSTVVPTLIDYYKVDEKLCVKFGDAINLINSFSHGRSYYDEHINFVAPKTMRNAIRMIIKVLFDKDLHHVRLMTNGKITKKVVKDWNLG